MSVVTVVKNDSNSALSATQSIDLEPISEKLRHIDPVRWSNSLLVETEKNYRRFLALHLIHPSESIVPNELLDEYWHQHILDTRKYAADCEVTFGSFLHHDPYFGIGGQEDRQRNLRAFANTQKLWKEAFGVSLLGVPNPCKQTDCR